MSGIVHLLLGSNIDDRKCHLDSSIKLIEERVGEILQRSSVYESESWGFEATPFYNQVLCVRTWHNPYKVLKLVLKIEKELGRERIENSDTYNSRTVDIDLLFYQKLVINSQDLILPHPRLHERMFTLLPLNEISSDFIHPVLKMSVADLVLKCEDKLWVKKLENA